MLWNRLLNVKVPSLQDVYPVGALFWSTNNVNPGTYITGTTWQRFGNGKVLVGVDEGDTAFNTVKKEGGAKTHTLIIAEMPSHTHIQNEHSHEVHTHQANRGNGSLSGGGSPAAYTPAIAAINQNTGGGAAHNNLQPYITVYIWERLT